MTTLEIIESLRTTAATLLPDAPPVVMELEPIGERTVFDRQLERRQLHLDADGISGFEAGAEHEVLVKGMK